MKRILTGIIIVILITGLSLVCIGATYQKYSKNMFYYTEFSTQNDMLVFLNNQKNLVYFQVVGLPRSQYGLYYVIKVYLEKCVYGCNER